MYNINIDDYNDDDYYLIVMDFNCINISVLFLLFLIVY